MADVLVLCYHGISASWPARTTVAPEDFEKQLDALVEHGYRGATLAEALVSPPSEKVLVVTFDDAHRSVFELAAPIMGKLGLPGTVFVPTDYPDSGQPMGWQGYDEWVGTEYEDELLCMSWAQLGELRDAGWEVGSHTCSHPRLSQVDDATIAAEVNESRRICEERMGEPCLSFAYPYSDYDQRAVEAAAAAGYRFAVTVPRAPAAPLPLQWPRVVIARGEGVRRVLARARARRLGPSVPARALLALRRLRR
jgi:peptidoglycan/xylan/chitin deacetylase (PgdA/CDA1 family)